MQHLAEIVGAVARRAIQRLVCAATRLSSDSTSSDGAREGVAAIGEPAHCCARMKEAVEFRCAQHPRDGGCPDYLLSFHGKFDEYGIWIHSGENGSAFSVLPIAFCPFCGTRLPPSRLDDWFDRLDALGLKPKDAPAALNSYGWWLDD